MFSRKIDYRKVFTPHAPIQEADLLVGREDELAQLEDYFHSPGAHPAVIGDRGVGKTSLIHNAIKSYWHARVNCSHKSTFNTLARAILKELGIDVQVSERVLESGVDIKGSWKLVIDAGATGHEKETIKRIELGQQVIDFHIFYDIIKSFKEGVIIVLDEYDRLPRKGSVKVEIAELVKNLADHPSDHNCTIVFVGIAGSTERLLGSHKSIHRQVEEVYLRHLKPQDISAFLAEAQSKSKIFFEPRVIEDLAESSMGFPYFTHLVGRETIAAWYKRKQKGKLVTLSDYQQGLSTASEKAYRHILSKYRKTVNVLSKEESDLIQHINVFRDRRIDVNSLLRLVEKGGIIPMERYDALLERMIKRRELLYRKPGRESELRFSEPLLQPFLRIQFGIPPALRSPNRQVEDPDQLNLFMT